MPAPEVCATCHREVRWGTHGGRLAWWHQDDTLDTSITRTRRLAADGSEGHEPVLGRASFEVDWAAVEMLRNYFRGEENEQEDTRIFDIPPPEIYATEIFVGDERLPGGARILMNAVTKAGGKTKATYSRGPRVHGSHGNFLGMSDIVVVKFRHDNRTGTGSWWDGKLDFSWRTNYDPKSKTVTVNNTTAKALRAWLLNAEWSE